MWNFKDFKFSDVGLGSYFCYCLRKSHLYLSSKYWNQGDLFLYYNLQVRFYQKGMKSLPKFKSENLKNKWRSGALLGFISDIHRSILAVILFVFSYIQTSSCFSFQIYKFSFRSVFWFSGWALGSQVKWQTYWGVGRKK